jgi:hypothetical protein
VRPRCPMPNDGSRDSLRRAHRSGDREQALPHDQHPSEAYQKVNTTRRQPAHRPAGQVIARRQVSNDSDPAGLLRDVSRRPRHGHRPEPRPPKVPSVDAAPVPAERNSTSRVATGSPAHELGGARRTHRVPQPYPANSIAHTRIGLKEASSGANRKERAAGRRSCCFLLKAAASPPRAAGSRREYGTHTVPQQEPGNY